MDQPTKWEDGRRSDSLNQLGARDLAAGRGCAAAKRHHRGADLSPRYVTRFFKLWRLVPIPIPIPQTTRGTHDSRSTANTDHLHFESHLIDKGEKTVTRPPFEVEK